MSDLVGNPEDRFSRVTAHIVCANFDKESTVFPTVCTLSIFRKITVHDTNPELFRQFLEYLYSGQLDLNEMSTEQLSDMMTLADRYDV